MAENLYRAYNGHQPTTGQEAGVTSSTSLKTMMQLETVAGRQIAIVEWGWSCTGSPSGAVIDLGTSVAVAATVTAYVAADLYNFTNPSGPASTALTVGTAASGFSSSAEGTIAAFTAFDTQVLTTNTYIKQFPLGREPVLGGPAASAAATVLRIRNTVPTTAVTVNCYIIWREQ
jgi:hypothetical protein